MPIHQFFLSQIKAADGLALAETNKPAHCNKSQWCDLPYLLYSRDWV